jgi:hypothetical protein
LTRVPVPSCLPLLMYAVEINGEVEPSQFAAGPRLPGGVRLRLNTPKGPRVLVGDIGSFLHRHLSENLCPPAGRAGVAEPFGELLECAFLKRIDHSLVHELERRLLSAAALLREFHSHQG